MRLYQCLKCGLIFMSKKQVTAHLRNVEKISNFVIDYYYQVFNANPKEANKIV